MRWSKNKSWNDNDLKLIEIWKKHLDKMEQISVILLDPSKAFNTISLGTLSKLEACGFPTFSLKIIQNYLLNRSQRTRINFLYRKWTKVLVGFGDFPFIH